MNVKRLAFARYVFEGKDHWEAAFQAGYGNPSAAEPNKKALGATAARLLREPEVLDELERLKGLETKKAIINREEVLAAMGKIVLKGEDCDKTQAARVLCKMNGWDAPKRVDVSGGMVSKTDAELIELAAGAIGKMKGR